MALLVPILFFLQSHQLVVVVVAGRGSVLVKQAVLVVLAEFQEAALEAEQLIKGLELAPT
jgi:hypothetical protein